MIKYKTVAILLLSVLVCLNTNAQKDTEEIYTNFEKNYNDLLQTYYIRTNEKRLNQRFGTVVYNNSSAASVSDEVYQQRLKSIPSCVNLVYNQTVRNHIIYYIDRIGNRCSVMLGVSKYYFPIFENILDAYGVPSDLKYLVMVESAFNPKAVSKAGATGLWQFMYATARSYDLRINAVVDDRCDPVLSTIAAAKYLKDLYSIYGDWSLVLAAYNCGPGNVNKAIKRSGKNSFWEIYQYLPKETRNYVPAFIASTYVMNFHSQHNIHPMDLTRPLDLINDTVVVQKDVYFGQIEKVLGISVAELKDLNPQYKMDYIPGSQAIYSLRLPFKYIEPFIELEDSIANTDKEKYYPELAIAKVNKDTNVDAKTGKVYITKTINHKVKRGETLNKIARRYGVSVSDLRQWNRNIKKNKLNRGTIVVVKQKVEIEKQKYIEQDSLSKENTFEDNIVSADNEENQQEVLIKNTPTKKTTNQITNTKVKPKNTTKTANKQTTKTKTYVVKSGDTVSKIAKKHNVSEQSVLKTNNLTKKTATKIRPGQKLKIPSK